MHIYQGRCTACHQMLSQTALPGDTWVGRSFQSNATLRPDTHWGGKSTGEIWEKTKLSPGNFLFFFCLLTTSDSWCCACLRWRSSCRQTYTDIWKCSHSGSRQSDHLALNLENGESSFYREVKWIQRAGNNTHYLPSGQTQDLMRFWREWLGLKLEQLGTKAAPCSSYTRSPGQVGAAGTGVQKIVIAHKMCFTK